MRRKTKVYAAATMLAATLAGSGTAYAYTIGQSTTGASVDGTWVWNNYHSGDLDAYLHDTLGDSASVYFLFHATGASNNRWDNNGGNGTTLHIPFNLDWGTGTARQYGYSQVCRNLNLEPDNCSSTDSYLNPYY